MNIYFFEFVLSRSYIPRLRVIYQPGFHPVGQPWGEPLGGDGLPDSDTSKMLAGTQDGTNRKEVVGAVDPAYRARDKNIIVR